MALLKDAKDFASRSSFEVQHTMYSSSSTLTYILTTYLGTINVLFRKISTFLGFFVILY